MAAKSGRRRLTRRRRPNSAVRAGSEQPQPQADLRALPSLPRRVATTSAQAQDAKLPSDTHRATAVGTAAAAAEEISSTDQMQPWQGSHNKPFRMPAQISKLLFVQPEDADRADESMGSQEAGVQLCQGPKLSRKRSAEASLAQPPNKRWRNEACPQSVQSEATSTASEVQQWLGSYTSSFSMPAHISRLLWVQPLEGVDTSSIGQQNSSLGAADVARLSWDTLDMCRNGQRLLRATQLSRPTMLV